MTSCLIWRSWGRGKARSRSCSGTWSTISTNTCSRSSSSYLTRTLSSSSTSKTTRRSRRRWLRSRRQSLLRFRLKQLHRSPSRHRRTAPHQTLGPHLRWRQGLVLLLLNKNNWNTYLIVALAIVGNKSSIWKKKESTRSRWLPIRPSSPLTLTPARRNILTWVVKKKRSSEHVTQCVSTSTSSR